MLKRRKLGSKRTAALLLVLLGIKITGALNETATILLEEPLPFYWDIRHKIGKE